MRANKSLKAVSSTLYDLPIAYSRRHLTPPPNISDFPDNVFKDSPACTTYNFFHVLV
jgi:hypothetical protein